MIWCLLKTTLSLGNSCSCLTNCPNFCFHKNWDKSRKVDTRTPCRYFSYKDTGHCSNTARQSQHDSEKTVSVLFFDKSAGADFSRVPLCRRRRDVLPHQASSQNVSSVSSMEGKLLVCCLLICLSVRHTVLHDHHFVVFMVWATERSRVHWSFCQASHCLFNLINEWKMHFWWPSSCLVSICRCEALYKFWCS